MAPGSKEVQEKSVRTIMGLSYKLTRYRWITGYTAVNKSLQGEKTSWHVARNSTELLQIKMEPAKEKLTTKEISFTFLLTKDVGKKDPGKWQQRGKKQGYKRKYRSLLKNQHLKN